MIIVVALIAALAAWGVSSLQTPIYSASAYLQFPQESIDRGLFGQNQPLVTIDPTRQAATNERLADLPAVAAATAKALGSDDRTQLTPSQIRERVTVAPAGTSYLVKVSAEDPKPAQAALLATTYANAFIAQRRAANREAIDSTLQDIRRQLRSMTPSERRTESGQQLTAYGNQLQILASLQTGGVRLAQQARVPTVPSSPRTTRNIALAFLLGFFVAAAGVLLRERLDYRIKSIEDLERFVEHPVLGTLPMVRDPEQLHSPVNVEAFRLLHSRLAFFNVDRELHVILITSCRPGEGKSTVAQHLSLAAAQVGGSRVLLVEADLRRPQLAQRLNVAVSPGLSEVLGHGHAVADAIQSIPVEGINADATLDVLVAGALPPNPAQLLGSDAMQVLLRDLSGAYDMIVVDAPPIAQVSDAVPIAIGVDGVVIVARLGFTPGDELRRLEQQLSALNAQVLGTVANAVPLGRARYGYRYGYRYNAPGPQPTEPAESTTAH